MSGSNSSASRRYFPSSRTPVRRRSISSRKDVKLGIAAPLRALWNAGYTLASVDGDTVVIAVPPL